jgi:hypothetical protein
VRNEYHLLSTSNSINKINSNSADARFPILSCTSAHVPPMGY